MKVLYSGSMARLAALDDLRGATIVGMILVNSPGNEQAYTWLQHAPWNGWTPADFVFPGFLVILGISLALSLGRRKDRSASASSLFRRAMRRSVIIFALGLISNVVLYDPAQGFRIMGVLQRISLCYAACAWLYLYSSHRWRAIATVALLGGYWILTDGHIDPVSNLACRFDRWVLGRHMFAPLYDPEGLLSTISAAATALMGVLAGEYLRESASLHKKSIRLLWTGAAATFLGWLWSFVLPLNKHLWTSSYALFTGGMVLSTLGALIWLTEIRGFRFWARPFEVFGRNPLLCYMLSGVIYGALEFVHLKTPACRLLFETWLSPKAASAAFALLIVAGTWSVMAVLDRKRIYLRI